MLRLIPATIGRVVLFWPGPDNNGVIHDTRKPFRADICFSWSDRLINISYNDHNGTAYKATSVILLQDNDLDEDQPFCTWMDYQKAQAAEHTREDLPTVGVGALQSNTTGFQNSAFGEAQAAEHTREDLPIYPPTSRRP